MGTRSITRIYDEENEIIVDIYNQYDGYVEGVGTDLINFIRSGQVLNGIQLSSGDNRRKFNGMGCFAAQLVAYWKTGAGGTYLEAPRHGNRKTVFNTHGIEYMYEVYFRNNQTNKTKEEYFRDSIEVRCFTLGDNDDIEEIDPYYYLNNGDNNDDA